MRRFVETRGNLVESQSSPVDVFRPTIFLTSASEPNFRAMFRVFLIGAFFVSSTMPELSKVWIIATGSRGDVQPYIAVGVELKRRGIDVRFYTSAGFSDLIADFGLTPVPICPRNEHIFNDTIKDGMGRGHFPTLTKGLDEMSKTITPQMCSVIMKDVETHQPDLVIATMLTRGPPWYLALKYRVPFIEMAPQALVYNPEHMACGLPTLPLGLHYYFLKKLIIPALYNMQVPFFAKNGFDMDIESIYPQAAFVADFERRRMPLIVLWSPELAAPMHGDDIDPQLRFVGSAVIESKAQLRKLDSFGGSLTKEKIDAFLKAGPKPVYLGWGSMISKSKEYMVELCARALYRSQQRGIILGGFAQLDMATLESLPTLEPEIVEYARTNLIFVHEAPHEWLFDKVAAIIHHGGAGTTTAALRAGVPTIITPVFVDQFDHARLVRLLGVGIGFSEQLQRISWQSLGDAIVKVVSDMEMANKAAALGEKLRQETGAVRAADEVASFWDTYCVTGKFWDLFPGSVEKKPKPLRYTALVSTVVAAGLLSAIAMQVMNKKATA